MKLDYPLYIASDHAGYKMKKRLIRFLENELEIKVEDMGPTEYDADDDFPDYIIPAAKKAVENKGEAILLCGSGIGACIAANKVKGMQAAFGYNIKAAETARQHNNANGLCLAGGVLTEEHAMTIVKRWLEMHGEFLGGKYQRRIDKINKLEE